MGLNLAKKIISNHIVEGSMEPGEEIAIKIDQTLTQDATGTMAYLQFEALGIPKVQKLSRIAKRRTITSPSPLGLVL